MAKVLRVHAATFVSQAGVYRLRDDNHNPRFGCAPRQHPTLQCPPMVYPMFAASAETSGTQRTPMDWYGWDDYLRVLNPGRFEQAVSVALAMFNTSGWPNMESLLFGCNLVSAAPTSDSNWARMITLRWESGPPPGMPDYQHNPLLVQAFTCICRGGAITARDPMLYYPLVSRYPVFVPWSWLEPFSHDMQTPPPPV